ncbi:hypothetical protein ACJD0Z_15145 [Flavobacteriaceae bacterium M23B6Z8]
MASGAEGTDEVFRIYGEDATHIFYQRFFGNLGDNLTNFDFTFDLEINSSNSSHNINDWNRKTSAFLVGNSIKDGLLQNAEKTGEILKTTGRYLKFVRGAGLAGSIYGLGNCLNHINKDYQAGGWENVNGWDIADAGVGAASIAATVFLASNPIRWAITGVTVVYFTARLVYDISNQKEQYMLKLYYKIWTDAIKYEREKHGHLRNWKVYTIIPISIIQGLNLFTVSIILSSFGINYNLPFEINLFPGETLDSALSGIILFFVPFLGLNYLLIFKNDRYLKIIEKYNYRKGRLYVAYFLISLLFFFGPIIIGKYLIKF